MNRRTKAELAAGYAESGLPAFPLMPNGKTPIRPDGWKELASTDPKRVAALWEKNGNCNIAIRTGEPLLGGYLVVVDTDVKDGKQGRQSRSECEDMHGKLPRTLTVGTPSGGEHQYYVAPWPIGNSMSKLGAGIDIKGLNGYVVAPGSVIDDKEYGLTDAHPIAQMPIAWVEACGRPRARSSLDRATPLVDMDSPANLQAAAYYLLTSAPAHGTYVVACRVRGWGISQEKCLELMVDHWPGAEARSVEHIETRVNNAYTYAQDPPGIACADVEFEPVEVAASPKSQWPAPADLWEQDREPNNNLIGIAPDYVNRFAMDRAKRLGVSAGAMTAATITTLSSLIPAGNDIHLRQNSDTWSVKSIIWTAIIGDPGTAKSPAVNAAMAFPEAVEKAWRSDYAKSLNEFERTQLHAVRKTKTVKKPPAETSLQTTEPVEFAAAGDDLDVLPPMAPKLRRKIVNDATTEALGMVLRDCPNEAPALFHSDELVGLVGGMDVYRARGTKDRPFFLQAKEGKPFAIDRKSSGTLLVPSLAVSIIGTIQDEKLGKIAPTLTDDGFLQRFALVMIRKTGRGADIPDDRALDVSIPRVAHALSDLETGAYRLHPEAACELDAIHDFADTESRRSDISLGLRTWLSKTPNEFGRYCLAFHLIEWAASGAAAFDERPAALVSQNTAHRARRYVEEFLYSHALYVYGTVMAMSQDDNDVRWVAGYILCRDVQTINAREIGRAYRSLRGPQRRSKLFSVMNSLAIQDWVKMTNQVRGEWRVNPKVHDGRFSQIRDSETERRTAVRGEIAAEAERRRSAKGDRP